MGPHDDATRVPVHASGASAARHRPSGPVTWAYGTPRNTQMPASNTPWSTPPVVRVTPSTVLPHA